MIQVLPTLPQKFPTGLDPTKKFFTDGNGNPSFLSGENAGNIILLKPPDIEFYLTDRLNKGFTSIIFTMEAFSLANANGDLPFNSVNYVNFNTPYWNYIDYIMGRINAYGINPQVNPFFVGLDDASGDHSTFYNQTSTVIQGFASFLGNRYKNYNLIWLLGGDADPNNATSWAALNTFAVALKAADPSHLMTIEASRLFENGTAVPNGGYSSVDGHTIAYGSVQSWLDFNFLYQSGSTVGSGAQRCYTQGYPLVMGEDYYENEHSTTPQILRQEGYTGVLGGTVLGRNFGNNPIYLFTTGWQNSLNSAGSVGQQLLSKLFRSRPWQKLVPDISNTTMTAGSSGGSFCARTNDGISVIVYIPTSQTITIDMSKITDSGNQTNCNWYNPQTGVVTNIGTFANSSTKNFTSPDSNDWVLVIDSNAANLRTPGT